MVQFITFTTFDRLPKMVLYVRA